MNTGLRVLRRTTRRVAAALVGSERTEALVAFRRRQLDSATWWHGPYRANARRVEELSGRHEGERCFIIGNGPSLRQTNLSPLRHETTFGLNRIYLAFRELGWATTYHVAVNRLVIDQCKDEIAAIPSIKFLPWDRRDHFGTRSDIHYLYTEAQGGRFVRDLAWQGVSDLATVTYSALQIAFFLGFREAILVGVDHSFAAQGPPNTVVTSPGPDRDHFDPTYFGRGFKWQLPDLETSETVYQRANEVFLQDGRAVYNATIGGALEVFPRISYDNLFPSGRA